MANVDQSYKEQREAVVATALFGEMQGALKGPEQRMAAKLRRKNETDNPGSIIDDLAVTPVSSVDLKGAIERVISVDTHPTTYARSRPAGSTHEANFNLAMERANFAQEFLKKGYSNFNSTDQARYQKKAYEAVMKIWPDARVAMKGLSDTASEARMDAMLRDPRFAAAMKTALQEVVESSKTGTVVSKEATDKLKAAKHEKEEKEAEKQLADEDYEKVHDEYEREYGATRIGGSKGDILAGITETASVLETKRSERKRALEKASKEVIRLQSEKAELIRRSKTAEAKDVGDLLDGVGGADGAIAREEKAQEAFDEAEKRHSDKIAFEADKKKLEEDMRRLKREVSKRQIASNKASDEYYLAFAEQNGSEMDVTNFESSFLSKLDGVVESATKKYLEGQIKDFEGVRDQVLEELGDDSLVKGLNDRWNKGKDMGEFNEGKIESDYRTLLVSGPDSIAIETLVAGGMPRKEALARFATDKAFADTARSEVAQRLLAKRVATGKITETEARRIVDSTWGGDEIIANAFAEKAKYDGTLQLLEQQGYSRDGFIDKLKSLSGSKLVKVLLLLFGLGSIALVVDALGGFGAATALAGKAYGAVSSGLGMAGGVTSHVPGVDGVYSAVEDKVGDVASTVISNAKDGMPVAQTAVDLGGPVVVDDAKNLVSSAISGVSGAFGDMENADKIVNAGVGLGVIAGVKKLRAKKH